VFVTASYGEGLPMTVLEAMALEIPIVATRVGEIPNVLGEGRFGRLFDAGDVADLTAAIEGALAQAAKRTARDAQRHYAAHYSRAAMARRYQKIYEAA
jgi:glycosyltransferase involved in cell wall biosynthesis